MEPVANLHVIWMNFAHTGHMNPTIPVVAELKRRGCSVSYYVEKSMRSVVEAAGATWRQIPYPGEWAPSPMERKFEWDTTTLSKYVPDGTPEAELQGIPMLPLVSELILPRLLDELRSLSPSPSVIVYDPFLPFAPVAAHVLGINSIGMLTMAGPGAMMQPDSWVDQIEAKPWVQGPRQALIRDYGYDILKGGLVMESYSSVQNIVTTIEELYTHPRFDTQRDRLSGLPRLCVGPLIDASTKRVSNAHVDAQDVDPDDASDKGKVDDFFSPLPWHRIKAAPRHSKKLILVSLGTVANGMFWDKEFGPLGSDNGVADVTGRSFCRSIWCSCLEALGDRDDILLVMAMGSAEGVLECLPSRLPENVILRASVPQLDLLPLCAAFITHGGANSVHEALSFGIPLVVVPIFGDQPSNGDKVKSIGAGLNFKEPLRTATPEALRKAVYELVPESQPNPYREVASQLSEKFRFAGGVRAATDEIMRLSVKEATWLGA